VDRGTRRLFGVVLVALVLVVGGAALFLSETSGPPSEPPDDTVAVEGVIVGVDSAGLGDVRSFDLRLDDGTVRTFGLAELENGDVFPPGHLAEHQVTAEPVRVWYRPGPEGDLAIRLEDAPR
jgi:hypothetical protein